MAWALEVVLGVVLGVPLGVPLGVLLGVALGVPSRVLVEVLGILDMNDIWEFHRRSVGSCLGSSTNRE